MLSWPLGLTISFHLAEVIFFVCLVDENLGVFGAFHCQLWSTGRMTRVGHALRVITVDGLTAGGMAVWKLWMALFGYHEETEGVDGLVEPANVNEASFPPPYHMHITDTQAKHCRKVDQQNV
jgi:hypothetical protein